MIAQHALFSAGSSLSACEDLDLLDQTGQVGLRIGSWTSNLRNAGSIPGEFVAQRLV